MLELDTKNKLSYINQKDLSLDKRELTLTKHPMKLLNVKIKNYNKTNNHKAL